MFGYKVEINSICTESYRSGKSGVVGQANIAIILKMLQRLIPIQISHLLLILKKVSCALLSGLNGLLVTLLVLLMMVTQKL